MHKKNILYGMICLSFIAFSVGFAEAQCAADDESSFCARERGDRHCNGPDDCCPGRTCNSFGYCERRR